MDWLEISLVVAAEAAEAVAEVLSRYVPNGVAIEQRARDIGSGPDWAPDGPLEPTAIVRGYLPLDAGVESKRQQIAEALWHLQRIYPMPDPAFREVKQAEWENAWKEHYHVLRIGRRFVIKPSWRELEPPAGDIVIELDPGMAFGTGLHPTTQMCLLAIEAYMPAGARVIDLGTGSGILAIAAAKLGAASVLALDIDPVAVESARENVIRNQVERVMRVESGSLDFGRAQSEPFDFALVNILAKIIVQLCEEGLGQMMRPGGLMVFAGLIDAQEEGVRDALGRAGLVVIDRLQDKDWVGLVCRRELSITDRVEQPDRRSPG